jgi:hypothetical protein
LQLAALIDHLLSCQNGRSPPEARIANLSAGSPFHVASTSPASQSVAAYRAPVDSTLFTDGSSPPSARLYSRRNATPIISGFISAQPSRSPKSSSPRLSTPVTSTNPISLFWQSPGWTMKLRSRCRFRLQAPSIRHRTRSNPTGFAGYHDLNTICGFRACVGFHILL